MRVSTEFNIEGKLFRSATNTDNGEVGAETVFNYHQKERIVWAEYEGGDIVKGHLVANVLASGQFDMRYHHVNLRGEIMIGKCLSTPELMSDGKLRFKEEWQWLEITFDNQCHRLKAGDCLAMKVEGTSVLENPTRKPARYLVASVTEVASRKKY